MFDVLMPRKRLTEVVKGLVRQFAEDQGLSDLDVGEQFEDFVAFSMVRPHSMDFDADDLRTGGTNDCGIDGFAVMIGNQLYAADPTAVKLAVAAAPQLDVHFFLIQAKYHNGYESDVFDKFGADIRQMFTGPLMGTPSDKAKDIRATIEAVYRDPAKFTHHGAPALSAWYAHIGAANSTAVKQHKSHIDRELTHIKLFRSVDVSVCNAVALRLAYRAANSLATVKFDLHHQAHLPNSPGVDKVIIGAIPASDLVDKVLTDPSGRHRQWVFDENMRDFLGADNQINSRIKSSLSDPARRAQFLILNNGITIVTKSASVVGTHVTIQDPLIINGCQTCYVLRDNRSLLDSSVLVMLRIVQSTDADVIGRMVDATNRQTGLTDDELASRGAFQRLLEDFFAAQEPGQRVLYERRTGQFGTAGPRSKVINSRHLTQAYAAMWLQVPHAVTRYKSLMNDYSGTLFRSTDDPMLYYACAVAHKRIERMFGGALTSTYRSMRHQLLFGVRLWLLGAGPIPPNKAEVGHAYKVLMDVICDDQKAMQLLKNLVAAVLMAAEQCSDRDFGRLARSSEFTSHFANAVLDLRTKARNAA